MSKALRKPAKKSEDFGIGAKTINGQTTSASGETKTPEQIKREALTFADELYKTVILSPPFMAMSAEARYKAFMDKYPNFMRTYVTVAQRMIVYLQYNSRAMSKFLEKMIAENSKPRTNDAKARASAFEERYLIHAEYVRHLYIEESKAHGKHYSTKRANEIRDHERKMLKDHMDKLKEQEKEAKNAFEDEAEQHKDQRKADLVEFIMRHRAEGHAAALPFEDLPSASTELDAADLRLRAELLGLPMDPIDDAVDLLDQLDNIRPASPPIIPIDEIRKQYTAATRRIAELESELSCKDCKLERMIAYLEQMKERALAIDHESWLIGTAAMPPMVEPVAKAAKAATSRKKGGRRG